MLNGWVEYIFGSGKNDEPTINDELNSAQPNSDPPRGDTLPSGHARTNGQGRANPWKRNKENEGKTAQDEDEPQDEEWILVNNKLDHGMEDSGRSSPVFLNDDNYGVMEQSTFDSLLHEDHEETETRVVEMRATERRALTTALYAPVDDLASQQAHDYYAHTRDFTQGKMKRGNKTTQEAMNKKGSRTRKERRAKKNSCRNNDRKTANAQWF